MKNRIWFNRIFVFCLGLFLMFVIAPQRVAANEPMEVVVKHNTPCEEVTFELYRVGDISENGEVELTGAFADYPVNMTDKGSAAEVLAGFAYYDEVTPLQITKLDAEGKVVLDANGEMTKGLYLVIGKPYSYEGVTYYTDPILVSMPNVLENGEQQNSVEIEPKYEELKGSSVITVVKMWKDSDEKDRVDELTALLIDRDSKEVYGTAVLNKENNWRYTFENLPLDKGWYIVEKTIGDNYELSVEQDGSCIVMINTHIDYTDIPDEPESPETPDVPDTPEVPDKPDVPDTPEVPDKPTIPDTPDVPDTPDTPDKPETPDKPKLPQTGVLWWPVPMLATAGLVSLLIGFARRKRYDEA